MSNNTPTVLVVEDEDSFVDALMIGLKRVKFQLCQNLIFCQPTIFTLT